MWWRCWLLPWILRIIGQQTFKAFFSNILLAILNSLFLLSFSCPLFKLFDLLNSCLRYFQWEPATILMGAKTLLLIQWVCVVYFFPNKSHPIQWTEIKWYKTYTIRQLSRHTLKAIIYSWNLDNDTNIFR